MAVLFLVVLFLIKNRDLFDGKEIYQENGLTYSNIAIKDLITTDTDGDGILDWEETLYGLDPSTKETTPGIPDSTAILKLKPKNEGALGNVSGDENLTETDKFSRELFSTVAALNQNGTVDQATIEQLGTSLAEKIKNPTIRKTYTLSDLKVIKDTSTKSIRNYSDNLDNVYKKYTVKYTVMDVLQKFIIDANSVDTSVLVELTPIVEQLQKIIDGLVNMSVPQSLASLHLDVVNGLERLVENLDDIRLYDADVIVSLVGINQYENNSVLLQSATGILLDTIKKIE